MKSTASVDRVRAEVGQLTAVLRWHSSGRRWRARRRVNARIQLPILPRKRRQPGEIWAVAVVRDERDVVERVIRHLFSQGIDHVLIADNRSQDGTRELLTSLAQRDDRVHVALDEEPAHMQGQKITRLAHAAWRAGADWILPFDADEFFFARRETVGGFLRAQRAGIIHAEMHHLVPENAGDLTSASWVWFDCDEAFPGKVAFRSHGLAIVGQGNHSVIRVGTAGRGLYIAHAQYRGPEQVARKARQGAAAEAMAAGAVAMDTGDHWTAGARLSDDEIQDAWRAMSRGIAAPSLKYHARGPMLRLQPFAWPTWDPDGEVDRAKSERPR
ncbi:MAG: glycosyltransferase family 2 protein [Actinomycetales bacterium]|nr:glycosyltransferase family 2 protein [Actinomycetales bacterium]